MFLRGPTTRSTLKVKLVIRRYRIYLSKLDDWQAHCSNLLSYLSTVSY